MADMPSRRCTRSAAAPWSFFALCAILLFMQFQGEKPLISTVRQWSARREYRIEMCGIEETGIFRCGNIRGYSLI